MKTIKIPINLSKEDKETIRKYQQQFSSAIHYSYNRILENVPGNEIERNIKELKNTELLDSWFRRCANYKAKSLLESVKELNKILAKKIEREKENKEKEAKNPPKQRKQRKHKWHRRNEKPKKETKLINPRKIIFGTKYNFYQRLKGKISKEEYKDNRLSMINVQGEANENGNRKFELNLDSYQIIFKPSIKNHIVINLPHIRRNIYRELRYIQEHNLLYSVGLDTKHIHISFDEAIIKESKKNDRKIKDRILGIDINPYYIGFSITDYRNGKQNILVKSCYDLTELNKELGVKSDDKIKLYQNNKRDYEILQIVKQLTKMAIHYQVDKISIEDLVMENKNHNKGKKFNRQINNEWNRNLFINKLKMNCNVFGIKLAKVNPAYSTFIGNLQYDYFDPVNASIEIGRRGKDCYVKGSKLYPTLSVKDQWKEYLTPDIKDWRSLYEKIRDTCRYRVSLDDANCLKFSRRSNKKKKVSLYSFL